MSTCVCLDVTKSTHTFIYVIVIECRSECDGIRDDDASTLLTDTICEMIERERERERKMIFHCFDSSSFAAAAAGSPLAGASPTENSSSIRFCWGADGLGFNSG